MICSNCKAEISNSAKFCSECGHKVIHRCPSCGSAEVSSTMKFCPECGYSLVRTSAEKISDVSTSHTSQKSFITEIATRTTPLSITPDDLNEFKKLLISCAENDNLVNERLGKQVLYVLNLGDNEKYGEILLDIVEPASLTKDFISNDIHDAFKKIHRTPYDIYNHFFLNIPVENANAACVGEEFVEASFNKFYSSNKIIFDDLYNAISCQQTSFAQLRDIKRAKNKSDNGVSELMLGASTLLTALTGGLAAPLAAMAGKSVYSKRQQVKSYDEKIFDISAILDKQYATTKTKLNAVNKAIRSNHEITCGSIISQVLSILNNMIDCDAVTKDNAIRYINFYTQSVNITKKNYDSIFSKLNQFNTNVANSKDVLTTKYAVEYPSIQIETSNIINRAQNLLADNLWFNFDFSISDVNAEVDFDFISLDRLLPNHQTDELFIPLYKHCNACLYISGSNKQYNMKRIQNFIEKNQYPINISEVLLFYDNTFFGQGEDGMLITHKAIYHNEFSYDHKNIGQIEIDNCRLFILKKEDTHLLNILDEEYKEKTYQEIKSKRTLPFISLSTEEANELLGILRKFFQKQSLLNT